MAGLAQGLSRKVTVLGARLAQGLSIKVRDGGQDWPGPGPGRPSTVKHRQTTGRHVQWGDMMQMLVRKIKEGPRRPTVGPKLPQLQPESAQSRPKVGPRLAQASAQGWPKSAKIGPGPIMADQCSGPVPKHHIWFKTSRESTVWPKTKTKGILWPVRPQLDHS